MPTQQNHNDSINYSGGVGAGPATLVLRSPAITDIGALMKKGITLAVLLVLSPLTFSCQYERYEMFPPWGNSLTDVIIPTERPEVKANIDKNNCLIVEVK